MKKTKENYLSKDQYEVEQSTYYRESYMLSENEALHFPIWPIVVLTSNWKHKWFRHENYSCLAVEIPLEGELKIIQRDSEFLLKRGDVGLIHPGEDSLLKNGSSGFCRKVSIVFTGALMSHLLVVTRLTTKTLIHVSDFEKLMRLVEKIEELLKSKDLRNVPETVGAAMQLLMMLAGEEALSSDTLFERAQDLIRNNIMHPFPMSRIAKALGIDTSTLYRMFVRNLKIGPKEYLGNFRIQRAKELLKNTQYAVNRIASETGFCNAASFSAEFRKRTGKTPLAYRKESIA